MDSKDKDEDFEFEDGEDDGWDENDGWHDVEELKEVDETEKILKESQNVLKQYNIQNQCWKCIECECINNVQETKNEYNMKCLHCGDMEYKPNITKTFVSKIWNTSDDYKEWICNYCTYSNPNRLTKKCEMCGTKENENPLFASSAQQNQKFDEINVDNIINNNTDMSSYEMFYKDITSNSIIWPLITLILAIIVWAWFLS
eukprot:14528_1